MQGYWHKTKLILYDETNYFSFIIHVNFEALRVMVIILEIEEVSRFFRVLKLPMLIYILAIYSIKDTK